jgi:hypothetical protein
METKIYETIGIGNYYGSLKVKFENYKCFWSIENWDGDFWEEITLELAMVLIQQGNMKRYYQ